MPDNTTADATVNMYWRIAGSTLSVTPSEACRAGALGIQIAGLDEFGVISHALTNTADALDALRESVEPSGCKQRAAFFYGTVLCGERLDDVTYLCDHHAVKRDAAIARLLGTSDTGAVDG